MSVNNQDRNEKKCVLCCVNNAQAHSYFCQPCVEQSKRDAGLRSNIAWLNERAAEYAKDGSA